MLSLDTIDTNAIFQEMMGYSVPCMARMHQYFSMSRGEGCPDEKFDSVDWILPFRGRNRVIGS